MRGKGVNFRMKRKIVYALSASVVSVLMVAGPAFAAHNVGPCGNPTVAAEPGHSEFAKHHIVPLAQSGVPGADRHVPGEHRGFSACNPSGR